MEISRRRFVVGACAAAGMAVAARTAMAQKAERRTGLIRSGQIWLDTNGKPIQAHAGSILQVADTFYWYGENKEFTNGKSDTWTTGVRCYASKDLASWSNLGLIVPPDNADPRSPLNPRTTKLDRPHLLFNARTKKFVMWVKVMDSEGRQTRTVLVADQITGPYAIVSTGVMPLGMNGGDFDLVVAPDDGKAYQYFERVHSEMICADLSDDYLSLTGYYSTHFPSAGPPLDRR